MINSATLIGNLGKDPELRETASGNNVCNFSLATSWKGSGEEQTTWHNIVVFGKSADAVAKYLKKGSKAYIRGRIQNRSYEKDGVTKYISEIVADEVKFLDSKAKTEDEGVAFDF